MTSPEDLDRLQASGRRGTEGFQGLPKAPRAPVALPSLTVPLSRSFSPLSVVSRLRLCKPQTSMPPRPCWSFGCGSLPLLVSSPVPYRPWSSLSSNPYLMARKNSCPLQSLCDAAASCRCSMVGGQWSGAFHTPCNRLSLPLRSCPPAASSRVPLHVLGLAWPAGGKRKAQEPVARRAAHLGPKME